MTGGTALDLVGPHRDHRGPALVVPGGPDLDRSALRAGCDRVAAALDPGTKGLVVVAGRRSAPLLVAYLAVLRAGHAALLVEEPATGAHPAPPAGPTGAVPADGPVAVAVRRFAPARVVTAGEPGEAPDGYGYRQVVDTPAGRLVVDRRLAGPGEAAAVHPALALLMATSGATGHAKYARLSYAALRSNATAVAAATGIEGGDRVVSSLPVDHSFGLSLVNSHLVAGAAVVVSGGSAVSPRFWWELDRCGGSTVGLVPYTAGALAAQRLDPARHPSLRTVLVAGGLLDRRTWTYLRDRLHAAGRDLYVMYGQTEATARMACERTDAASVPGSAGAAVPGGRIEIRRSDGSAAADGETGEIVYHGPNVMLGYAHDAGDLARGDECGGVLPTGDLGVVRSGRLHVLGRRDRQVKVMGLRVELERVEALVAEICGVSAAAVATARDAVDVVAEHADRPAVEAGRDAVARELGIPASCVRVRATAALPRSRSGKVAYAALAEGDVR